MIIFSPQSTNIRGLLENFHIEAILTKGTSNL